MSIALAAAKSARRDRITDACMKAAQPAFDILAKELNLPEEARKRVAWSLGMVMASSPELNRVA